MSPLEADGSGPHKCCRTAWESEVWCRPRPRLRLIASSWALVPPRPARCRANTPGRSLASQPFVPAPSTICWGVKTDKLAQIGLRTHPSQMAVMDDGARTQWTASTLGTVTLVS